MEQSSQVVAESSGEPAAQSTEFKPTFRLYAAFWSLCMVVLAVALDATSLSVALPIISHDLNGTAIEAFWSGTSFLLASTVFQLIIGAMSQSFGRKQLTLVSLLLFTVGAIVAAVAKNFDTILAGRVVQGAGGGGIIALSEIVITDLIPLRERGKWFGYQGSIWAIGSVGGPLVGGAFASNATWRWIFWINLPICFIGFVLVMIYLNLNKLPGAVLPKVLKFDWVGVVLLTGSATSFLMAISWGNVMFPWSSWRTIVPVVLGLLGLVAFVVYEGTVPKDPMVRLAIFKQRSAVATYIGTCIHGIILWSLLYYMPLYYECVKDYSPVISGVAVLPETFTVAPIAIVVGILVSKWGSFRWAIWSGWTISILGMGLLYLLDPQTTIPQWVFLNIVPGLGLGMLFSSQSYGVQASCAPKDVAYAASMYGFSRSFGQGIGVAIGGAIFQTQFSLNLKKYPALAKDADNLAKDASALVQLVKDMDRSLPERAMIVEAYADSLKVIWAVMAGLAFIGLLASFFIEALDVNVVMETEQGLMEEKSEKSSA